MKPEEMTKEQLVQFLKDRYILIKPKPMDELHEELLREAVKQLLNK